MPVNIKNISDGDLFIIDLEKQIIWLTSDDADDGGILCLCKKGDVVICLSKKCSENGVFIKVFCAHGKGFVAPGALRRA